MFPAPLSKFETEVIIFKVPVRDIEEVMLGVEGFEETVDLLITMIFLDWGPLAAFEEVAEAVAGFKGFKDFEMVAEGFNVAEAKEDGFEGLEAISIMGDECMLNDDDSDDDGGDDSDDDGGEDDIAEADVGGDASLLKASMAEKQVVEGRVISFMTPFSFIKNLPALMPPPSSFILI